MSNDNPSTPNSGKKRKSSDASAFSRLFEKEVPSANTDGSFGSGRGRPRADSRKGSILSHLKFKLHEGIRNLSETQSSNDESENNYFSEGDDEDDDNDDLSLLSHLGNTCIVTGAERKVLRQAYYNLLCSILDPNAYLNQPHSFQVCNIKIISLFSY